MSEEKLPAKSKIPACLLGAFAGVAGWVIALYASMWAGNAPASARPAFFACNDPVGFLFCDHLHNQVSLALLGFPILFLMFGIVITILAAKRQQPRTAAFFMAMVVCLVPAPLITIGICGYNWRWPTRSSWTAKSFPSPG